MCDHYAYKYSSPCPFPSTIGGVTVEITALGFCYLEQILKTKKDPSYGQISLSKIEVPTLLIIYVIYLFPKSIF